MTQQPTDLLNFQQQVIVAAQAVGRQVPGGQTYVNDFLRALGLENGPTAPVAVPDTPAEIDQGVTALFSIVCTMTAKGISEQSKVTVQTASTSTLENLIEGMIRVNQNPDKPSAIPQDLWDNLTITVDKVDLEEVRTD